ncbi:MAG: hypothetical protein IPP44_08005, partial [Ideonella sp.]|nr:hypothetical protein [Ideonella sp.]
MSTDTEPDGDSSESLGCPAVPPCSRPMALAQPAAPRNLRPDLSQTERDLAAMQSEIDFWERITLDRDVLVLPVQTNMGSIAIPARR